MCIYIPALLSVSLPRFQVGIRLPISSTKRRGCRLSPQRNFSPAPLGNPVLRTLGVGGSEAPLGRSAPGAPPARRGSPFLPRNGEKEGRGSAPGPRFHGRSFPLAGFGDGWLWYGRGAITNSILKPIWDAFFGKICWKAFLRKKVSKSGYADGYRTSSTTVPLCPTTPKRASGNERPLNPGGAGGIPPRLFASGLSLEKAWIPRPGPGGNPPRRC